MVECGGPWEKERRRLVRFGEYDWKRSRALTKSLLAVTCVVASMTTLLSLEADVLKLLPAIYKKDDAPHIPVGRYFWFREKGPASIAFSF
jgi:hypothetical protein